MNALPHANTAALSRHPVLVGTAPAAEPADHRIGRVPTMAERLPAVPFDPPAQQPPSTHRAGYLPHTRDDLGLRAVMGSDSHAATVGPP